MCLYQCKEPTYSFVYILHTYCSLFICPQIPETDPNAPKVSIKLLSIDAQFRYQPVGSDYGPLCLGQIVRFVRGLAGLLRQPGVEAVV